jgi:hypothetical protein
LTFIVIVLVVVQHFSSVEMAGLMVIVDFAIKIEYGGQKQGAKQVRKTALSSDNGDSMLLAIDH